MPKLYDLMVRMNDEDIRKEYMVQMEIILNDDPSVSERVKGIAEGMSIKLGEMMDTPRHQRIAKLAKEEEDRKQAQRQQQQNQAEAAKSKELEAAQRKRNGQAYDALEPAIRQVPSDATSAETLPSHFRASAPRLPLPTMHKH